MKRFTIWILTLFTLLINLFVGCDGLDENYSTNPNHRLGFSADTLAFDTVFTTIGSATKQMMVYNRNNEPLNIEKVMLASPGNSGFRINVDGRKGDQFNNVRIAAEDSMYIFVEVTVNPNGVNQPLLIEDSIIFYLNGTQQTINLEAYGQDVNLIKGGLIITKDTYLAAERPYLVYDSITINEGVTVEIEKGATFYMHDKANLIVAGTLKAGGTTEEPITFRGDRLDFVLDEILPYDRTPGQWGGIFFRPESYGNSFNNVIVRNGTTGITCEISNPEKMKLKINNSQITNMSGNLFCAINSQVEVINSELTNAIGNVVTLIGGKYTFIHCTIANFLTLQPGRNDGSRALKLMNNAIVEKNGPYPITQAYFDNCIIDGSFGTGDKPLNGELSITSGETLVDNLEFNYRFNHCLIKTVGENNNKFTEVIFTKKSPSYRMLGNDTNKYTFDFRPDSATTLGVGKADLFISLKYPVDRLGINRLTNENPDIGAYEFVPKEEKKK